MKLDIMSVSKRKYNLYKLFILYWAQSPHSKGAQFVYRHVLQKPQSPEQAVLKETVKESAYSYLDGYQPPHLLASNHSSDDDDSVQSGIIVPPPVIDEKQVCLFILLFDKAFFNHCYYFYKTFPLLNESAW